MDKLCSSLAFAAGQSQGTSRFGALKGEEETCSYWFHPHRDQMLQQSPESFTTASSLLEIDSAVVV